jgi:hypothetical protein
MQIPTTLAFPNRFLLPPEVRQRETEFDVTLRIVPARAVQIGRPGLNRPRHRRREHLLCAAIEVGRHFSPSTTTSWLKSRR